MSRYIDADALKIPSEEMIAKMIINSAPSIDIVFCKECKWRGEEIESGNLYHWCRLVGVGYEVDDIHFCSYGEREGE